MTGNDDDNQNTNDDDNCISGDCNADDDKPIREVDHTMSSSQDPPSTK